jgi:hypothetical protein
MFQLKSIITIPKERLALYVLLVIIVLTGIIRIGLLGIPLERDEGEYAYTGQLILQGIPPYQEVYNMKFPGIYAAYALMMSIFGESHQAIHLSLLLINAITIALVFFLAKEILNPFCALISSAVFAVLSLSSSVHGAQTNAEHFVIIFASGGLLLLLRGIATGKLFKYFLSGLLLGLGFVMKQHGAAFIAVALCYLLYDSLNKKPIQWRKMISSLSLLMFGVLVVVLILCIIMYLTGVYKLFLFWTITYASTYISQVSVSRAWFYFMLSFNPIISSGILLWIIIGLGFFTLLSRDILKNHNIFLLLFTLFSISSICPGFYFREHYFILLLPCASILAGVTINAVIHICSKISSRKIIQYGLPGILIIICLFQSIYKQREFLFKMTYFQIIRSMYQLNPFNESIKIAEYLKEHTTLDDKIAIFGSEPQIFFYSKRRSASGYIYMYPLMEKHTFALSMQKNFLKDVETVEPKYLLYTNVPTSWLINDDSHLDILQWMDNYLKKHNARLVGLVELYNEKSLYYWGKDIKWPASSKYWVAIFKLQS